MIKPFKMDEDEDEVVPIGIQYPISEIQERYCNRRIAHMYGMVTEDSCFMLKYYIERIVTSDEDKGISPLEADPITIRINTGGGALAGTFTVVSYMEYLKEIGYTIITEATGTCCSAGFYTLMCGSKGHRRAFRYTDLMLHQHNVGIGRVSFESLERQYFRGKRIWATLSEITLNNTKLTKKQLDKMSNQDLDWFMTPEEALEYGVIDGII